MPRQLYLAELDELHHDIARMGEKVTLILSATHDALHKQDDALLRKTYAGDARINAMDRRIEQMCLNLIALQQPIASDLRAIASALKILTDMERIADQCADICEILLSQPEGSRAYPPAPVLQMLTRAKCMFQEAIQAYLEQDTASAKAVCSTDDQIDAMFSSLILELCSKLSEAPQKIPATVDHMFIAKYVERIGDHATNIAEWAIYLATGEHPDLNTQETML